MKLSRADAARVAADIEAFAKFNSSPGGGITRYSFSEEDRQARQYFLDRARGLGLEIRTDPVGNLFARMRGTVHEAAPVLTGSHLDTVPHGGKYDGAAGVVAALEAFRIISASGAVPARPLEIVVFTEEEGPHFGLPLAGSRSITGIYDLQDLKTAENASGISLYTAARDFGLDIDLLPSHLMKAGDVSAMIEVHIEQSVVLDREGISLGIVSGIAGRKWLKVRIKGEANHAGATPMKYRKDALLAAARVIRETDRCAREDAASSTVATVGRITCRPNTVNVIPSEIELMVDIRDTDQKSIDTVHAHLKEVIGRLQAEGYECSIETASEMRPTICSRRVSAAIETASSNLGISFKSMPSGALHDAAVMAGIMEIGMIFLPSKDGRSHVPEEETAVEDIARGAEVLAEALLRLSGDQE